ncbi:MAG: PEP-CTERM sorting domain-containing protein [Phycisphaerae bacterium]|nr:PEP-CTERM sorting domain-containing protein [Phycisphaerae bacterium]
MRKLAAILMLVAVVGLVAGPASADIYSTGFEASGETYGNFTDGDINGQNGWTVSGGSAWITTTDAISGSRSQRAERDGTNADARKSFAAEAIISAEVKVMRTTSSGAHAIFLGDANGNWATTVLFENGNITVRNGGSYSGTLGTFVANDIVTIKMVANATTQTYDAYIGGSLVADDYAFRETTLGTLNTFRNFVASSNDGLIDDLVITPEPATMTLLLLGLPFALRRRRRA